MQSLHKWLNKLPFCFTFAAIGSCIGPRISISRNSARQRYCSLLLVQITIRLICPGSDFNNEIITNCHIN